MRRRITRTLLAAAAAGVTVSTLGFTAAGAASAAAATKAQPATIGTSIASTTSAGYQASGRDFRYISSTITVPDTDLLTGIYPQEYIQLSNGSLTQVSGGGDQYTRAGIESCVVARSFGDVCITGTWVAYVEAFNNSLSGPYFSHFFNLAGVNQGDGVNFSIYYDSTGTPIALPPFIHSFRINQFLQGALTTYSGPGQPGRGRSSSRPTRPGQASQTGPRLVPASPACPG